ncbi:AAA family ATPase [Mycobacterium sp. UM_Kg1]|uniref:AAA family ATPase n=1 Tax=Mycobacterium sp. UM_Kg1 TaxID=1545691 RepID=UPI0009E3D6EF|nr:AAA family ATPase [Mycobacterium sp. UM_Kg1]
MRFVDFRFEGFKSLRDVSLELGDVTVVTGPNGAGKTNLAEALTFLSEALHYGLEIAVARAGGFANIAHHGPAGDAHEVGFRFLADLNLSEVARSRRIVRSDENEEDLSLTLIYHVKIVQDGNDGPSNFKIGYEYLELADDDGKLVTAKRTEGGVVKFRRSRRIKSRRTPLYSALYPLSEDDFIQFAKARADSTTLIVQAVAMTSNLFSLLALELGQLRVFQLSPQLCRKPGISAPQALLSRHGENLPAVVDNLKRTTPMIWKKVMSGMRTVLPKLDDIDTSFTEDRRLSLIFKFLDSGRAWNANEMSDGTMQALALFVALFDARCPLLIVEEPENALHPWILRHFLDLCREQKRKQILLTTHSPIVIDYSAPKDLCIMWNRNGESNISPVLELSPEVVELWRSGEVTGFNIYDSGFILEYLPEEFVPAGVEE